jgi:hypothetical protein
MSTTILDLPTPLARANALAETVDLNVSITPEHVEGMAGIIFWSFANADPEQTTLDAVIVSGDLDETAQASVITQAVALITLRRTHGDEVLVPMLSRSMKAEQNLDVLLMTTERESSWNGWNLAVTMAHRIGVWDFQPFKVDRS